MDTMEAIVKRRSVRHYKTDPIPDDVLNAVVDAGRWAPTGRGAQPCRFVVVRDAEVRGQIAGQCAFGRFIAQAPACVIVVAEPSTPYFLEDGAAATENILLAATANGLGSCWVAGHKKDYVPAIKQILGVPPEMELIALIALGYADEEPRTRKKLFDEVVRWERW